MLERRSQNILNQNILNAQNMFVKFIGITRALTLHALYSTALSEAPKPSELPRRLHKTERKPLVVPINELKRRARSEKQMRKGVHEIGLRPPENGLLVKSLIPTAHEVYAARTKLFACISKVMESIPVYSCSSCGEIHVGLLSNKIRTCYIPESSSSKEHCWERGCVEHVLPKVESFHLYDRVGRAVSHGERLEVDQIPAIVELCVQGGVDISEYPTRRRTFPVYSIAGKIKDFERRFPKGDAPGKDINEFGFWEKNERPRRGSKVPDLSFDDMQGAAVQGMEAWEKIRTGSMKLMQKYAVQTCGFCPEVQVGLKGHRVRNCQAFKHQMRDGQHAWQDATIGDLLPPVYVWHVRSSDCGVPLLNELKRYYGKLPAAVELFAQAGAQVGQYYTGLMREDVALPGLDEVKWVV